MPEEAGAAAGDNAPKGAKPPASRSVAGGLMFALGISWCLSTEYLVLQNPQVLPYVYVAQIIPLLIYRFYTYWKLHWQHYTLELCYFSNALLVLYILAFPKSDTLFLINFGIVLGPVLTANVVYRCSMLLDDLQRFISWFMHVMPPVVVFCLRWLPKDDRFRACAPRDGPCLYDGKPYLLLVLTLASTVGHAVLWNLYVWVLSPASVRAHPAYENSYLYLTRKVGAAAASSPACRVLIQMLNCFGPRGRVVSFTLMAQAFNAAVIGLAYAAWASRTFAVVYLLVVVFVTAYYGGTFYVWTATKAAGATKRPSAAAVMPVQSLQSPGGPHPPKELGGEEEEEEPVTGGGTVDGEEGAGAGQDQGRRGELDDSDTNEGGASGSEASSPPGLLADTAAAGGGATARITSGSPRVLI